MIVDDGSTDKTEVILQEYLKDPRIRYIKKENSGSADSRNYGAEHSTGEFLGFLDSDDVWGERKLQVVSQYIKEHPKDSCFYSGFDKRDSKTNTVTRRFIPKEGVSSMQEELKTGNPIHAFSTVVIPKEVFLKVKGFDIRFKARQDVDLYYRISKVAKFIAIPEILVTIYYDDIDRISSNLSNRIAGYELYLKKHGKEMSFSQRSFLAKKIVGLAVKDKSLMPAVKYFPKSAYSIVKSFLD